MKTPAGTGLAGAFGSVWRFAHGLIGRLISPSSSSDFARRIAAIPTIDARPNKNGSAPAPPAVGGIGAIAGGAVSTTGGGGASTTGSTQPAVPGVCPAAAAAVPAAAAAEAPAAQIAALESAVPKTLTTASGSTRREAAVGAAVAAELPTMAIATKAAVYLRNGLEADMPVSS